MSVRRRARAAVKKRHQDRQKLLDGLERMKLELLEQLRKDAAYYAAVEAAK